MSNVTCPSCRQLISISEGADGGAIACPACQREFLPADAGIAAGLPKMSDMTEGRTRRSRAADDFEDIDIVASKSKWRSTQTGLSVIWWTTVIALTINLVMGASMAAQPAQPFDVNQPQAEANPLQAIQLAGNCINGLAAIASFVGMCLCVSSPDPTARRLAGWTIAVVVFTVVVNIVVTAIALLPPIIEAMHNPGQPLKVDAAALWERSGNLIIGATVAQIVLAGISSFLWLSFHVRLANHFRSPALRRLALITLAVTLVSLPINRLTQLAASTVNPGGWIGVDAATMFRSQAIVTMTAVGLSYSFYLATCARTIAVIRDDTAGHDNA